VNGFCNLDLDDQDKIQYLDDPACEPIWAMLAKLKVPLYLHPRSPPLNQQRLYKDYPNLAQAAYGFGVETAGHALRIMCSGTLDRYPSIQIILGHCAEGLPFLIHRIDHRMAISTAGTNGAHKKSMMEYLQNNFYATCAGVRRESTLKNTIEEMGESRTLFSVDYPYESNEDTADWFDGMQINENTREALASGNAKRLLNID
jgi:predicted TIM-barrel fold metal-dependent hydrolase